MRGVNQRRCRWSLYQFSLIPESMSLKRTAVSSVVVVHSFMCYIVWHKIKTSVKSIKRPLKECLPVEDFHETEHGGNDFKEATQRLSSLDGFQHYAKRIRSSVWNKGIFHKTLRRQSQQKYEQKVYKEYWFWGSVVDVPLEFTRGPFKLLRNTWN